MSNVTTSVEAQISAIVLAGGESSRMGQDKALLRLGKGTLLSHVCQVASECTAQTYVISPWIEKYQHFLPHGCQPVQEQLVLDAASNTPLIGFAQGIKLVKTEWVLLLACDLPHLSSSQVKQWLSALTTVLPTEIAFLPRSPKGWEPLCGFYRRDCLASLKEYIAEGGASFQTWLKKHPVRELEISDRHCLFNCNTPEDFASVNQKYI
ncbi:MAG: molybdenum cofactor guanylyltransferase [Cyanobacteria bacterium J06607_15]